MLWHRVVLWYDINVSEGHAIFRVKCNNNPEDRDTNLDRRESLVYRLAERLLQIFSANI